MARDFEDIHDLDDLSDDELRDLVRSHLREHRGLDADDITVAVEDGVVRLEGRVGTDGEMRIAGHVVTDVIGVEQLENELVVDPNRRAQSPEAVDDHLADEAEHAGLMLGDRPVPLSPEAETASDEYEDELRTLGSTAVGDTIEKGVPWIPPERPTPEGYDGQRSGQERGEDH